MAEGYFINKTVSRLKENDGEVTRCSKCGQEFQDGSLQCLPEISAYVHQLLEFMRGTAPEPKKPYDSVLVEKYGYDGKCMFCRECLNDVIRFGRHYG